MMGGPISDAATMMVTSTIPVTARRLRRSRRQASFHREVPATGSPAGRCSAVSVVTSVANARVEQRVGDVDEQVQEDDRDGDEGDDADDERLVTIQIGIDEVVA